MALHTLHAPVEALIRRTAREVVMPRFQQLAADDIMEKTPGDLVTVADRLSEAMLSEGLAALLPEAAIVAEEAVAADPAILDRMADDAVWVIDPIDGTHNYAHGRTPFAIMVALVIAGETEAGWIYDPVIDRLCDAHRGHGARIDGERITARESGRDPPLFALSLMFVDSKSRQAVKERAETHYELVDIPRCAGEQYPRVALGQNDIARFTRTLPWDHAAGALFLNEAGGMAARLDGVSYRPGDGRREMIAASSPRLWEAAARHLG